jgi:hypothetical protein
MSSRSDPSSKQIKQITKEQLFMVRDRMYCSGEYAWRFEKPNLRFPSTSAQKRYGVHFLPRRARQQGLYRDA